MNPSATATNGGPMRRTVTITNPQGFHMRPARAFVELALQYQCAVRVERDDKEPADGRSILSLMMLAAEQGSQLTIEVDGPDGPTALDALTDLLVNLDSRVNVDDTE